MTEVVLECRSLSKEYAVGPQSLQVLQKVDLRLHAGERVAIVGSSGSSKTTLLNMLGGLDTPTSGEVWLAGRQMSALREAEGGRMRYSELGFVYQFHHLLPEFTALEHVCMPLLIGSTPIGEARQRGMAMLERVGLAQRAGHKPAELSGGERQRVAIARELINEPACVLLDEPTGNLDQHTARSVQQLILELSQRLQTAFLVVTHDLGLAAQMDRALTLSEGRLVERELEFSSGLTTASQFAALPVARHPESPIQQGTEIPQGSGDNPRQQGADQHRLPDMLNLAGQPGNRQFHRHAALGCAEQQGADLVLGKEDRRHGDRIGQQYQTHGNRQVGPDADGEEGREQHLHGYRQHGDEESAGHGPGHAVAGDMPELRVMQDS